MPKFCEKCGNQLIEGQICSCAVKTNVVPNQAATFPSTAQGPFNQASSNPQVNRPQQATTNQNFQAAQGQNMNQMPPKNPNPQQQNMNYPPQGFAPSNNPQQNFNPQQSFNPNQNQYNNQQSQDYNQQNYGSNSAQGFSTEQAKQAMAPFLKLSQEFIVDPVGVVCENAQKKNTVAAAVFIGVAVVIQTLSVMFSVFRLQYGGGFSPAISAGIKEIIAQVVLFGCLSGGLFFATKIINKTNSDFIRSFITVGIAAIPYTAAVVVTCVLGIFYSGLNSIIFTLGQMLFYFTLVFAVKKVENIESEKNLIMIVACAIAVPVAIRFLGNSL